ncbi:hypothetical protein E4U53_002038 [Claviceps sorghi]|nr:hypothetical protein E4U53_002038 [Claviceps sorghi]
MKYTTLASLAAASALAQHLSQLPSCATDCLNGAVKQASTCSTSDLPCICRKFDAIQGAAASCVLGACGTDVALRMSPRPNMAPPPSHPDKASTDRVLPATRQLCAGTPPGGYNAPVRQPGNSVSVLPQPVTQPGRPRTSVTSVTSLATTPAATVSPTRTASTSSPVSTAGAAVVAPVGGLAVLVAGGLALL